MIMGFSKKIRNDINEELIVVNFVSEEDEILKAIKNTELSLECAYTKFHNVTEPELIDSCIYEIKALQTKYNYLMGIAKTKQIRGVMG
jgi:hypothetical protein